MPWGLNLRDLQRSMQYISMYGGGVQCRIICAVSTPLWGYE